MPSPAGDPPTAHPTGGVDGTGPVGAGGPAAIRGFRLQSLYALHRLLEGGTGDRIQPEGAEDLAVYRNGVLAEACQVKARGDALALSDLQPERKDGFLRRAVSLLRTHPEVSVRLVSFGPIGPELRGAVAGNPTHRTNVIKKLGLVGFRKSEVELLLDRISLEEVHAETLLDQVIERIRSSAVGHDPVAAADLLVFWVQVASETQRLLDPDMVVARLAAVGRYLAERSTAAAEWFTTIEPIVEAVLTTQDRERLLGEFAIGVAAQFEHITAGAAIPRTRLLGELRAALVTSRVVVVHGASGEGKTALALAYMADLPGTWRFRVRDLEGSSHARAIATALRGHARALQVPLVVHVDVGPADEGWPVLVRELTRDAEVRVLVTVREEDWRRTRTDGAFTYADLELSLSEDEAREIFGRLRERDAVSLPSFEDAWARFGGRNGPLLEFVHLCTQGEPLRDRLSAQVRRLEDEVREGRVSNQELALLRLVSVASSYEAGVDFIAAAEALGLPAPRRTVDRFEREYLVRAADEGRVLLGLHPVRSAILTELLLDPLLSSWNESAATVLPLIVEADLERFLMYALSRQGEPNRRQLYADLARISTQTWSGTAGVVHALVWRGLADYAEANRSVIDEAQAGPGTWHLLVDWDVGRVGVGLAASILDGLAQTHPAFAQAAERALQLRGRQSSPDAVFSLIRAWFDARSEWPGIPRDGANWAGLGEVAYWSQQARMTLPLAAVLDEAAWKAAIPHAAIDDLADAAAGLSVARYRPIWWSSSMSQVMDRFREEAQVASMADDGSAISIEFLIDVDREVGARPLDPHAETMRRVELLRRLLPDRQLYSSRGHGHRLIEDVHDATLKQIPAENLPPAALAALNGTFLGYTERWFRLETWDDYWQALIEQRLKAVEALTALTRLITAYFRHQAAENRGAAIRLVADDFRAIGEQLRLPREAVDEWGFVSESRAGIAEVSGPGGISLQPYVPFWHTYRDYQAALGSIGSHIADALLLAMSLGRRADGVSVEDVQAKAAELGVNDRGGATSLHSLRRAGEHLVALQRRTHDLAPMSLANRLTAVDARELSALDAARIALAVLLSHPERRIDDVVVWGRRDRERRLGALRGTIESALSKAVPDAMWTVRARPVEHDDRATLLITGDWSSAASALAQTHEAIAAIAGAIGTAEEVDRELVVEAYPAVLLVTLIRGRPLAAEAVVLDSLVLGTPGYEPKWWGTVPSTIDSTTLREARLDPWDDPAIGLADQLLASAVTVWAYLRHLADLRLEQDLDELGLRLVREHLDRVVSHLERTYDGLAERSGQIASMLSDRGVDTDLPNGLLESVAQLGVALTQGFSIGQVASLNERLDDVVFAVTVARAIWIDTVLADASLGG